MAIVSTPQGQIEGRIRDISERGARMEGKIPETGTEVLFSRGDTVVPARVVWAKGKQYGLTFLEPVNPSAVLVPVAKPAPPVAAKAYRRPRLTSAPVSEQDLRLTWQWGDTGPPDNHGE